MRRIDAKYAVNGEAIYNTSTSEDIPYDEPLFLLRARDRLASHALAYYAALCEDDGCTHGQVEGAKNALARFLVFRRMHPDRMKQPGSAMVPKV
jgi:hypothetical protein